MSRETATFDKGHVIFREGDDPDRAYLIKGGTVDITVRKADREVLVERIGAGQIFGELALLDDVPRSATAATATGCVLIPLSKTYLDGELARLDPLFRYWLFHAAKMNRDRLHRIDPRLCRRLTGRTAAEIRTPAVSPASALVEEIWQAGSSRFRLAPGEVVFEEGDPASKVYIIRSGSVQIVKVVNGMPKRLANLGPRDIFGELALTDASRRSASAVAIDPTELIAIEGCVFQTRLRKQSPFIQHWVHLITARLRSLSERIDE